MLTAGQEVRIVRDGVRFKVRNYWGAPDQVYIVCNANPNGEPEGSCHIAYPKEPKVAVYVIENKMLEPVNGPW